MRIRKQHRSIEWAPKKCLSFWALLTRTHNDNHYPYPPPSPKKWTVVCNSCLKVSTPCQKKYSKIIKAEVFQRRLFVERKWWDGLTHTIPSGRQLQDPGPRRFVLSEPCLSMPFVLFFLIFKLSLREKLFFISLRNYPNYLKIHILYWIWHN